MLYMPSDGKIRPSLPTNALQIRRVEYAWPHWNHSGVAEAEVGEEEGLIVTTSIQQMKNGNRLCLLKVYFATCAGYQTTYKMLINT